MSVVTNAVTALNVIGTKKAVKTPERLLEDALASFTKAEDQLVAAQAEVERQSAEWEAQRATLDAKIENADGVISRLARIRQRFTDLLA